MTHTDSYSFFEILTAWCYFYFHKSHLPSDVKHIDAIPSLIRELNFVTLALASQSHEFGTPLPFNSIY